MKKIGRIRNGSMHGACVCIFVNPVRAPIKSFTRKQNSKNWQKPQVESPVEVTPVVA